MPILRVQTNRPTLSDVARRAGVSKATASRVLSESRDRVSDELARKVLESAAQLCYVPNPHARALARAGSPAVGVIVHDVADPYFAEIARGAFRIASDRGRLVMICTTFWDASREVEYLAEMRAQRIHALLVAGTSHAGLESGGDLAVELDAYRAEGGRVALMTAGLGFPAVVPDDRTGGQQAGRHLVGLGHVGLGVVAGPEDVESVTHRLAGFTSAVEAAGLAPPATVYGDFTRDGGEDAAEALFQRHPETTAVLALNDLMAAGVLRYLARSGRSVPDDVSVMGFDDIPLSADLGLTTIRVPMGAIGAAAMELLLTDDEVDPGEVQVFPTELMVRRTTSAPASSPP